MDELTQAFEAIRRERDTPAVHRLLLDVWEVSQTKGEAEALNLANTLLAGVRAYHSHERELLRLRDCDAAGPILGERSLPVGGEWWALLESGHVAPSSDKRSGGAVYWAVDASGWWRVSAAARRAVA